MKKLFVVLAMLLSFGINAQEKVGEVRSGSYVITASLNLVKPVWAQLARDAGFNDPLIFTIEKITNDDSTFYYCLYATNAAKTVSIATGIELSGSNFLKLPISSGSFGGGTLTCSGCNVGCHPKYLSKDKVWICWPGCVDGCTKTETITTKNFSSQ
ncbi:hypothetical protein HUK80_01950 [Flavobacterium sp. MAH-1]|uniref:Uncharacterized protein n=1 Tax=Flavobacterium agri TaxID=2743471 RepID=A0A7Y8XZE5_9FLAO|nr:hypothetical protein [Flavobacterium agri]NUY79643.1 hypothetical protein [Flavobacterium agri]NYA69668.1 hypothetical protein [Flavobacterium agri]